MANGPARTSGYKNYESAGTSKFSPLVFSSKMLRNFYETTCFEQMANTEYSGEIKGQGDKVIIRTTPVVAIADYTVGKTLTYEVLESANTELNISEAKSWSFRMDDIDEVQSDLQLMNKFAADAGERMKIAVDKDCLSYVVGKAATTNKGAAAGAITGGYNMGAAGAPLTISSTNATSTIIDINTILDN